MFRGGWVFCHIFEKYQGYFFAKKGGGGCFCQIRKLPGYFFKVEGVGGGERHDFRKPIICAIKKVLALETKLPCRETRISEKQEF